MLSLSFDKFYNILNAKYDTLSDSDWTVTIIKSKIFEF
jgi:hypothetical protein